MSDLHLHNLISSEFKKKLTTAFELLGTCQRVDIETTQNITRAYYVLMDIECVGYYSLKEIPIERLEAFHTVLYAYIIQNKSDEKSTQLFERCDSALAELKNPKPTT